MNRLVFLGLSLMFLTGLSVAFSSSTEFVQEEPGCNGVDVNNYETNVSVNDTIDFTGTYCANTGGYTVVEESVERENGEVEVIVSIEGPSEGDMVTQVITPVDFNVSEEVQSGDEELNYELELYNDTLESGEEVIQATDSEETGFVVRFREWFTGFF